jgi:hypothetical protein
MKPKIVESAATSVAGTRITTVKRLVDVLRAIVAGTPDGDLLAAMALQAENLEFRRGAHW